MKEKTTIKLFGLEPGVLIWDIVKYIVLFVFVVICIYPFYYVVIYSLSDPQMATGGIYLVPKGFTLNNYKQVLGLNEIKTGFFNSIARTVLGTIIATVCTSMLAYVVTKDMYGRKIVYRFIIITMYVGGGLVPWYLVMNAYGLTNTFLAYIVPGAVNAYNMILVKTYFEALPASLEESAAIEGAGFLTTFFKIILPLSKPIIATIAVYTAVSQWNSWSDNYFLNNDTKLMTLQLVLRKMLLQAEEMVNALESGNAAVAGAVQQSAMTPATIRMTSVVVTIVPIMLVYPFAQKYYLKGIMMGAVKG